MRVSSKTLHQEENISRSLMDRDDLKRFQVGKTSGPSQLRETCHLIVIAVHRGMLTLPIEAKTVLRGGDILLIVARPEDMLPERLHDALEILPWGTWQEEYLSTPDLLLIEAAIAPRSTLAGQTLWEIQFEQKFKAKVLAIWRQGRSIRTRLRNQPLPFGECLVLHWHTEFGKKVSIHFQMDSYPNQTDVFGLFHVLT